jgi:outer membrane biosynthesis protein TonB
MKFLLFNVAVATALVFLFTADRGEVQKVAGQVHDAAGDVKAYADKALAAGQTMLRRDAVTREQKANPATAAAAPKPVAPPVETSPSVAPAAQPAQPPAIAQPRRDPPPPPRQVVQRPAPAAPAVRPSTRSVAKKAAPAGLDPAVAKRRQELLDGLDTADNTVASAPALKEGTRLMSPSDRRKELLTLAEEMELLYARSISQ